MITLVQATHGMHARTTTTPRPLSLQRARFVPFESQGDHSLQVGKPLGIPAPILSFLRKNTFSILDLGLHTPALMAIVEQLPAFNHLVFLCRLPLACMFFPGTVCMPIEARVHTESLKDFRYMFSMFQDIFQNKTTAAEGHPSTKQHIILQMWTVQTIDLIIHNTKPLFEDKILPS
jgi:hypothetical protein